MTHAVVLVASDEHPLDGLEPAVRNAASIGARIAIDVNGLSAFAVREVRQLIILLRAARDRGASVALRVGSEERRRSLAEMGLDRVFAIDGGNS
jgi:anti-anti-sigma regulatory factor